MADQDSYLYILKLNLLLNKILIRYSYFQMNRKFDALSNDSYAVTSLFVLQYRIRTGTEASNYYIPRSSEGVNTYTPWRGASSSSAMTFICFTSLYFDLL
jgi:hypothetical protein